MSALDIRPIRAFKQRRHTSLLRMKRTAILIATLLVLAVLAAVVFWVRAGWSWPQRALWVAPPAKAVSSSATGGFFSVAFPEVKLAENEYIESVEVAVQAGMIATMNWIPPDWSIELYWDTPELTRLTLQAGHFPAGLTNAKLLDGFITVDAGHPTRFEVKATLLTEIPHPEEPISRTHVFNHSQLVLKPVSRPSHLSRSHVMPPEFREAYIPPPPQVNAQGQYVVRKGDTLESIAALHGLSLPALRGLNPGLHADHLVTGQLLRVRKAASAE